MNATVFDRTFIFLFTRKLLEEQLKQMGKKMVIENRSPNPKPTTPGGATLAHWLDRTILIPANFIHEIFI